MTNLFSRKKRQLTAFLLAGFIFVSCCAPAFAANIQFKDVNKNHWARPYVEKMFFCGVINGMTKTSYAPQATVTRAQIITMIIRVMGCEDEAQNKTLPNNFPNAKSIPPWAMGYVALAVEKGIVSADEDFRPEDPVKRHEVAVFTVKALGLGKEAESRKNVNLNFADLDKIPLEARSYVELAVENEILKGLPGNLFNPTGDLTRAEAANLLTNFAKKMPPLKNVAIGEIVNIDLVLSNSIKIKQGGKNIQYNLNSDTCMYKLDEDNKLKEILPKDINIGDSVEVIYDDNNTALYLEITTENTENVVKPEPDYKPEPVDKKEGFIINVIPLSKLIIVEKADNNLANYVIEEDTVLIKDGKGCKLEELKSGDIIRDMVFSNNKLTKLSVESGDGIITGVFKGVNYEPEGIAVIIQKDNGKQESYELDSDVKIKRNNKMVTLKDLKIGEQVEVTLSYGKTVNIIIKKPVKQDVIGTIKSIFISDDVTSITLENDDGKKDTIKITSDTEIVKDRDEISVYDLRVGYYIEAEVGNDEVAYYIDATAKEIKDSLKGIITNIYPDFYMIVIKDSNDKKTKQINFTEDTIYIQNNKEIKLKKINEGDEILAIGRYDKGVFTADTIILLTISK